MMIKEFQVVLMPPSQNSYLKRDWVCSTSHRQGKIWLQVNCVHYYPYTDVMHSGSVYYYIT